ncbi:MAG: hypothetical protein Kow00114_19390 [Kiloniellaceae bacterium]
MKTPEESPAAAVVQLIEASAALRQAARDGRLDGVLTPAVFGCPYGHTAGIVTAPLPLGRCGRCGADAVLLDAAALRRAG